jgi:hypothetical protein
MKSSKRPYGWTPRHAAVAAVMLWSGLAAAAPLGVAGSGWTHVGNRMPAEVSQRGESWIRPAVYSAFQLNLDAMKRELANVPMEFTAQARANPVTISVPMPDGRLARFTVAESPVMHPELAAKFPQIKTYKGQGVEDPTATIRFMISDLGFTGQIFSSIDGRVFIDPYTRGDTQHYTSYNVDLYKKDAPERRFTCATPDAPGPVLPVRPREGVRNNLVRPDGTEVTPSVFATNGTQLRTFDLVLTCTGEYGAASGGQAGAVTNLVNMTNRLNQVYEIDLATRLQLVANNNVMVYDNAATDPYTAPGTPSTSNTQGLTTANTLIGAANFDVVAVVHFAPGSDNGLANGIGNVCGGSVSYSAGSTLVADPFTIDYVAHEIGHNFNGRHCFANCSGGSGDSAAIATEPGSGVTIMAYAGICGANNIASNSVATFGGINLDPMSNFVAAAACDTVTATGNNPPNISVVGGTSFSIPSGTAFTLTASGSDPDGDVLTYSWEQMNGVSGVAMNTGGGPFNATGTSGPITRPFLPTTNPSRTIPGLAALQSGLVSGFILGEGVPSVARTLNFRVIARDNRAGAGGLNTADMTIAVQAGGPFRVNTPSAAGTSVCSGPTNVTWDVAGSNAAPINTANVRILLSTDNGVTFPTVLANSVPNTGSATVTLPNIATSQARIRVEAVGNIFFAMSRFPFSITSGGAPTLAGTGTNTINDAVGNGNGNNRIDPGESDIRVFVEVRNSGCATATNIVGTLQSLTPTVTVPSNSSIYDDIAQAGTDVNSLPYVINVSSSHTCGNPINLRLNLTTDQGPFTYDFTLPTGLPGSTGDQTFNYTGTAIAIPDGVGNGTPGLPANAAITVSGLTAPINYIKVRVAGNGSGTGCTSPGVTHTWVGDVRLTLIGPGGQSVVLVNRLGQSGTNFGNSGDNFCNTLLDSTATFTNIQTATLASQAPFSGTWNPANTLTGFNGLSPNGTWTLRAEDLAASDLGSLNGWQLIIGQPSSPPTCQPPVGPSTGACCLGVGCTVTTAAACTGAVGTTSNSFKGIGTVCNAPGTPPFTDNTTPCCRADFNQDGTRSPTDIFNFLTNYFSAAPADKATTDTNGNGSQEPTDIFGYLTIYFAGGCA